MAPALSKLTPKNVVLVASSAALLYWLASVCVSPKKKNALNDVPFISYHDKDEKKEKAIVDGVFFRQLRQILKILFPGVFTPECGYALIIASSLLLRTMCDIWMIHNGTVIESAIIGRNTESFKKNLKSFAYTMPLKSFPHDLNQLYSYMNQLSSSSVAYNRLQVALSRISFVNNMLKYSLQELKLRFRTRLSLHLYDQYLSGLTYYRMNNLDNRIANPDHLLTQDVEKFCNTITDVYSNLSKPLLDILLFVRMLTRSTGFQSLFIMVLYLAVAGTLLTRLRRPIGRMTVTEQKLEGELRFINSRIMMNSEEIAFYRGNTREKLTIQKAFKRLTDHLRNVLHFKFSVDFVDTIVAKYVATMVGYLTLSLPFFGMKYEKDSHAQRLETYYKNGRMLVKMAEAIGRLVLAGRDLNRLAGYTARVAELMRVLKDIKQGHYERTMVNSQPQETRNDANATGTVKKNAALLPGAGKIVIKDKIIRFEKVPLVTPNGDLLVENLTFEVKSGMNVLVCGPNGCGKSSLFRILGELWPLFGGTVIKPSPEKLFYIPQKPYMALGTFRDQVIYPDSLTEMRMKGITNEDLEFYLKKVQLLYLLEREGGWDAVQDWMDVLSGGEKQRIAMARLFYHKPQFAILDECTSAVSVDVEGSMYQYCRQVGISLFTVSHRKSLWQYHEYYLYMDGRGSFEFKPVTAATEEFGS